MYSFFWVKLAFEFRGNTVVKNQLRVNSSTNGRPNSTNIIFHLFCGKLNYTFVLESQSSINSATHNTVNNNLVFVENQLSINSSTIQWKKIIFHKFYAKQDSIVGVDDLTKRRFLWNTEFHRIYWKQVSTGIWSSMSRWIHSKMLVATWLKEKGDGPKSKKDKKS